jgi:hypothetical protein
MEVPSVGGEGLVAFEARAWRLIGDACVAFAQWRAWQRISGVGVANGSVVGCGRR